MNDFIILILIVILIIYVEFLPQKLQTSKN
jgi:hypothetical protein